MKICNDFQNFDSFGLYHGRNVFQECKMCLFDKVEFSFSW